MAASDLPPVPPDDTPPPPPGLGDPLEASASPASADALRAVLTHHRRRQTRVAWIGLVLALVAGSASGFAAGRRGRGPGTTQVAAGARPAAGAGGPAAAGVPFFGAGAETATPSEGNTGLREAFKQLLVRDAVDGTRVRLYERPLDLYACAPEQKCAEPTRQSCAPSGFLTAEVSDDQVAGQAGWPWWATASTPGLTPAGVTVVGQGQPQPILVTAAHTGAGVARVTLTTPYGNDIEVPAGGWVALAVRLPAGYQAATQPSTFTPPVGVPGGTLTAVSPSGALVSTVLLSSLWNRPSPACEPGPPVCSAASPPATVTPTTLTAGSSRVPTTMPPVACLSCAPALTSPPTTSPANGPPTTSGGAGSPRTTPTAPVYPPTTSAAPVSPTTAATGSHGTTSSGAIAVPACRYHQGGVASSGTASAAP